MIYSYVYSKGKFDFRVNTKRYTDECSRVPILTKGFIQIYPSEAGDYFVTEIRLVKDTFYIVTIGLNDLLDLLPKITPLIEFTPFESKEPLEIIKPKK